MFFRLMVLGFLVASGMAFGQADMSVEVATAASKGWALLGAGLAMGLAVIGAAGGQGKAGAAALEGIARNPQSRSEVFNPLLITLALIEFQTLLAFAFAMMVLFSK